MAYENDSTLPKPAGYSGSGYKSDYGNDRGGYGKGGNQGGSKFPRKERPEDIDPELYLSVAFMGDKNTPEIILSLIPSLVRDFEQLKFKVRGGADGPVELAATEAARKDTLECIMAWKSFNESLGTQPYAKTWNTEAAKHVAKKFHKAYDMLPDGTKSILAKNARMVMGDKMRSPATALIIWTPDGVESGLQVTRESGYAAHAISIASAARVPVFNLKNNDAEQRIRAFLDQIRQAMNVA